MGHRRISGVLLNLAALAERADEALLPTLYKEMSTDLRVEIADLEWITFLRGLSQALAAPLGCYFAQRHSRVQLVAGGAMFWAIATASLGVSTSYWQAALASLFNGVGMAIAGPAIISLVADLSDEDVRGMAFGWVYGAGQLGPVLVATFWNRVGSSTVLGMPGWRITFMCMSLSSVLVGLAIFALGYDPRSGDASKSLAESDKKGTKASIEDFLQGSKLVLGVGTFRAIVILGLFCKFPWNYVVYFKPWMRLVRLRDTVFYIMSLFLGSALGSCCGGWVGDKAAKRSDKKGRITLSQSSVGLSTLVAAISLITFQGFTWPFGFLMFSLAFFLSWVLPAAYWPIVAEVVPEELRSTAFAIDWAVDRSFFAVCALFVASVDKQLMGTQRHSLYVKEFAVCCCIIGTVLGLGSFLLYQIYPQDKDQAKKVKALVDELRVLEMVENWEPDDVNWDDEWEHLNEDEIGREDLISLLERDLNLVTT